jgi:hypothetical protein
MIFKRIHRHDVFLRVLYDAEKISYNKLGSLSTLISIIKTPSMPPSGWFEIVM